jgi:excisionase family DNA binding protein
MLCKTHHPLVGGAETVVNCHMATQSTTARPSRLGLSTSQAARELGVSLGTVRRWADMGYLRAYRTPGGQRRFNAEQIEAFVRSLEQRGHARPPEHATS